tara:strand:- start:240 stop:668 length:429 start_codon:yes stop_codon:yes gene_type:complete
MNYLLLIIFIMGIAALVIGCLAYTKPLKSPQFKIGEGCQQACSKDCGDFLNKLCGPVFYGGSSTSPDCSDHGLPPTPTEEKEDRRCWSNCVLEALGEPPDFPGMKKFTDKGCRPQCDLLEYDPTTPGDETSTGPCKCAGWCF